jgi:hypothetical protein
MGQHFVLSLFWLCKISLCKFGGFKNIELCMAKLLKVNCKK